MKRIVHALGFLAVASFATSVPANACCGGCCQGGMEMGKGMMMGRRMGAACGGASQAMTPAAAGAEKAKGKADATRHPLRGVIVAVHADTSELRVKHEAIPGVMRAMTMMFKVDPATIKAVKQGQAITAQMSRENDAWWLHDVKVVGDPR